MTDKFNQQSQDVQILDVVGMPCPMPILKLKKFLAQYKNSTEQLNLQVFFSDKGGFKDIPAFCQQTGLHCRTLKEGELMQMDFNNQLASKEVYCLVLTYAD